MISNDRVEKAVGYLVETDDSCASLKADMARAEFKAKATKDAVFKRSEGSVADRQATANTSKEHEAAMAEYFTALYEYEKVKNKRATEAIVVDTWRSQNARRREGNV